MILETFDRADMPARMNTRAAAEASLGSEAGRRTAAIEVNGRPVVPFAILFPEGAFAGILYVANPDENLEEAFNNAWEAGIYPDCSGQDVFQAHDEFIMGYMSDLGYDVLIDEDVACVMSEL